MSAWCHGKYIMWLIYNHLYNRNLKKSIKLSNISKKSPHNSYKYGPLYNSDELPWECVEKLVYIFNQPSHLISVLSLFFVGNLLHKYEQAGFQTVWFASAFKGASGIDQMLTPIDHHLNNHLQWHKVIQSMSEYKSMSFQGIVLTGWQRWAL